MNEILQENKLTAFIHNLSPTSLKFPEELLQSATISLLTNDFPTTRKEAWKYTRVGRIAAIKAATKIENSTTPNPVTIDSNALTFVFENGVFVPGISSAIIPEGISIKPLSLCDAEELSQIGKLATVEGEIFTAMNVAHANDGLFIKISDHILLEQSIQITHIICGENNVSNFRNYIHAGKFSKAHIIQGFFSQNAKNCFSNVVTEIVTGENAFLTIDKIQYEEMGNFHVATEEVHQEKDSTFTINTLTLDGTLVRNNLNIGVKGVNCTTHLNGIYLLKENQHVDNHTIVDHCAPNCESHELYKGVMDDSSTAVFNGKVFVRKDSQKINAFQSNANVLLSDSATINSKPELEIYADDVKCSHGSTTGQLDDEAIFYLRARGISEKSARHLMVSAFIGDVLGKIENEKVLEFTHSILKDRFGWEF